MGYEILPQWALLGVVAVALFPANLFYDVLWGLFKFQRIKWYAFEAICDSGTTLLFMVVAYHCGLKEMPLAMIGVLGCTVAKCISMAKVGLEGILTTEKQRVPEWWVYVGTCMLFPVFLLDTFGPVTCYWLYFGFAM